MAFKKKAVVNARLDQLSKAELIRTVKTLRGRETKLLNQVAKLESDVCSLDRACHEYEETELRKRAAVELREDISAALADVAGYGFPWETK